MKFTLVLLGVAATVLILVGCSYKGPKTSPEGGTATLANTYWKLLSIDGNEVVTAEGAREAHLILRPDFRVIGFGGCNNFSGTWLEEEDQLSIGPLMSTMMACDEAAYERDLLANLNGRFFADIEGEILTVLGSNGSEMIFQAVYLQ
jgi:heat shock protein HslJ